MDRKESLGLSVFEVPVGQACGNNFQHTIVGVALGLGREILCDEIRITHGNSKSRCRRDH